jgi:hypothetical protein
MDVPDFDKSLPPAFLEASVWPVGEGFAGQAMGDALIRQALLLAQHHSDAFWRLRTWSRSSASGRSTSWPRRCSAGDMLGLMVPSVREVRTTVLTVYDGAQRLQARHHHASNGSQRSECRGMPANRYRVTEFLERMSFIVPGDAEVHTAFDVRCVDDEVACSQ